MTRASSPFVLRVFGVYRGIPQGRATDERDGIVIEYMKRGTLESLLERLRGHPPWPLAFRLANQLALGMNFLHEMVPSLLHKDLKPSNVLLDDDLNVKVRQMHNLMHLQIQMKMHEVCPLLDNNISTLNCWSVCHAFVFWVQLADFGLSRVSNSNLKSSEKTTGDQAGTLVFTPPEAFELSYQPVRSYDIYRLFLNAFPRIVEH